MFSPGQTRPARLPFSAYDYAGRVSSTGNNPAGRGRRGQTKFWNSLPEETSRPLGASGSVGSVYRFCLPLLPPPDRNTAVHSVGQF
jgi:hypothetical protein